MQTFWYAKKVKVEGSLIEKWTAPIEQLSDRDLEELSAALMDESCKRANKAAKDEEK